MTEQKITDLDNRILNMIKNNKGIKLKEVVEKSVGISEREIRKSIQNLRMEGYPICNTGNGYYYPTTKTEIGSCIRYMKRGISGQEKTIGDMRKAYRKFVPLEKKKELSILIETDNGKEFYYYRDSSEKDILIFNDIEFETNYIGGGNTDSDLMFFIHEDTEIDGNVYPKNSMLQLHAKKVTFPKVGK